jgi:hypothetical protein
MAVWIAAAGRYQGELWSRVLEETVEACVTTPVMSDLQQVDRAHFDRHRLRLRIAGQQGREVTPRSQEDEGSTVRIQTGVVLQPGRRPEDGQTQTSSDPDLTPLRNLPRLYPGLPRESEETGASSAMDEAMNGHRTE